MPHDQVSGHFDVSTLDCATSSRDPQSTRMAALAPWSHGKLLEVYQQGESRAPRQRLHTTFRLDEVPLCCLAASSIRMKEHISNIHPPSRSIARARICLASELPRSWSSCDYI